MGEKLQDVSRRKLLKAVGMSGGVFMGSTGFVAASGDQGFEDEIDMKNPDHAVEELAVEYEPHPRKSMIAFTGIGFGDGYQLYLARGAKTSSDTPQEIVRLTDARHGVHALSWQSQRRLRYSKDGATYGRIVPGAEKASISSKQSFERKIDTEPLPIEGDSQTQATGITTQDAKVVKCTSVPFAGDWCVRVHAMDNGHPPKCTNQPPPPAMKHSHFSIYPQSDAHGGINMWSGAKGPCFYVGEEHYKGKCARAPPRCDYDGELPDFGTIKNAYKEMIEKAADAAGIAIPAVVIAALAYILAGLTVKPPSGVPV